ncbi:hypothetical protein VRY85_14820, partial [Achromobacter sp. F4_2707]|uniref:hypothetical protein n=1 Tax=Achromobacter sp. F4_2707 TaxID=3114286 RepID=UPI0039C709F3
GTQSLSRDSRQQVIPNARTIEESNGLRIYSYTGLFSLSKQSEPSNLLSSGNKKGRLQELN